MLHIRIELKRFSRYDSLIWVTCVGIGSTCLADILIAVSMCWCLYHKRTGFKKTDSTIMTLILYSINTGLLTSVLAIGTLVFVRRPFISLTFFLALGRCYVNSLFAMLNNRNTLRGRSTNDSSGGSFAMSSIRQSKYPRSPTGPTTVAVTVHKTATTDFARCKHGYGSEPSAEESEKSEESRLPSHTRGYQRQSYRLSENHDRDLRLGGSDLQYVFIYLIITSMEKFAAFPHYIPYYFALAYCEPWRESMRPRNCHVHLTTWPTGTARDHVVAVPFSSFSIVRDVQDVFNVRNSLR
ncbi:hypothetical protein BC826DRAFT_728028 [Russula brevipes]|nr:hypothetical protein BC826DRAFT_728028 [Russula brevipes]